MPKIFDQAVGFIVLVALLALVSVTVSGCAGMHTTFKGEVSLESSPEAKEEIRTECGLSSCSESDGRNQEGLTILP